MTTLCLSVGRHGSRSGTAACSSQSQRTLSNATPTKSAGDDATLSAGTLTFTERTATIATALEQLAGAKTNNEVDTARGADQ